MQHFDAGGRAAAAEQLEVHEDCGVKAAFITVQTAQQLQSCRYTNTEDLFVYFI